jgi:hypothetical protein
MVLWLVQSLLQVLRAHPYIWIVSVLLTVVLMAAGVVGVLAAAQTETRHRKDSATGACSAVRDAAVIKAQRLLGSPVVSAGGGSSIC